MITLDKAHEEINGRFEETVPQEGDIVWYPDEEYGFRFVYIEDHWEHQPE